MNEPTITPEREKQDEILRGGLMRLTLQPELWKQDTYLDPASFYDRRVQPQAVNECGTVGCLAGWMVHDAGLVRHDPAGVRVYDLDAAARLGITEEEFTHAGSGSIDWEGVGGRLAGLNYGQAVCMFAGFNTLRTLWAFAAEFTDGRVTLPEELAGRVAAIDAAPSGLMAAPMGMVNIAEQQLRYAARRITLLAAHWHAMFIVALEDEQLITEAEGDHLVALWDCTPWRSAT